MARPALLEPQFWLHLAGCAVAASGTPREGRSSFRRTADRGRRPGRRRAANPGITRAPPRRVVRKGSSTSPPRCNPPTAGERQSSLLRRPPEVPPLLAIPLVLFDDFIHPDRTGYGVTEQAPEGLIPLPAARREAHFDLRALGQPDVPFQNNDVIPHHPFETLHVLPLHHSNIWPDLPARAASP